MQSDHPFKPSRHSRGPKATRPHLLSTDRSREGGGPKEMHVSSHPKATAAAFGALERHRDAARQEVSSSSPRVEDEKALNWRRNAKNKESNPRMKPGRALGPAGLLLADPTQGTFRDRARTEPTPERPRNGPAQPRPGKEKASRCRRTTNSKGLVLFCFVSQPPPLFNFLAVKQIEYKLKTKKIGGEKKWNEGKH